MPWKDVRVSSKAEPYEVITMNSLGPIPGNFLMAARNLANYRQGFRSRIRGAAGRRDNPGEAQYSRILVTTWSTGRTAQCIPLCVNAETVVVYILYRAAAAAIAARDSGLPRVSVRPDMPDPRPSSLTLPSHIGLVHPQRG